MAEIMPGWAWLLMMAGMGWLLWLAITDLLSRDDRDYKEDLANWKKRNEGR